MFTEEKLISSKEFQDWITGRVSLIYNLYKEGEPTFIVLHSDMGKWTITRFFKLNDSIEVSVDYENISTDECYKILLSPKYTRKLI